VKRPQQNRSILESVSFSFFTTFGWKTYVFGLLVLVVVGLFAYFTWGRKAPSPYETITVTAAPMQQIVSVTGKVEAQQSVDLGFSIAGTIATVGAQVGQTVNAGDVLTELDASDLTAQLSQGEAQVDAAQAQLASLQAGTRPEQIAVTQAQVASDQSALIQANAAAVNSLQSAYAQSDDAVHNKVDQFFNNPRTATPTLLFTTSNSQLQSTIQSERAAAEPVLASWQSEVASLSSTQDLANAEVHAQADLAQFAQLLSDANAVLNAAVYTTSVTQSTVNGYITSVATARANINAAQTALTTAITAQTAATSALSKDQKTLALQQAGATADDIAAQEAQVMAAQANVQMLQAKLENTMLRAPFSGVVTRQDAKSGAAATPGTTLVSLASKNAYEIETYVAEADIAKVALGNSANVTLDAYGDSVPFTAKVISIDPAETVLEGVSTYKVDLLFTSMPQPVKSGMTANTDIITATRSSALSVPARAVYQNNGMQYVKVLHADGTTEERKVTTGIQGSDGSVEITSGLAPGENVVTYTSQ
jgi:HlyD family secretion protein